MAKKAPRSLEYMKQVQNFGEQHPDFHASHREYKRTHPEVFGKVKAEALKNRTGSDTRNKPFMTEKSDKKANSQKIAIGENKDPKMYPKARHFAKRLRFLP